LVTCPNHSNNVLGKIPPLFLPRHSENFER
jgi:hypothetical protein